MDANSKSHHSTRRPSGGVQVTFSLLPMKQNNQVISYIVRGLPGLKVIVNINQDEYTELLGEEAGARVVVHPQYRMPFPEDEGFVAKPGKLTSVGMRKVSGFQTINIYAIGNELIFNNL
jgi:hypothetical protein